MSNMYAAGMAKPKKTVTQVNSEWCWPLASCRNQTGTNEQPFSYAWMDLLPA